MLDALKFVQGGVAKKDFVPSLTHFRIENGTIKGFNGSLGLSSPINIDLEISPKATPLIKAIQTCKETVSINVTPTGRLCIKSGKFKAFIDCTPELYPDVEPTGNIIEITKPLLPAIKKIAPFISEDASRPWARGILFSNQSAFATNNIVMIEYYLGYQFPVEINVPHAAIKELLRINEEPIKLQISEKSITFHFEGNRWLKSNMCQLRWPNVASILDKPSNQTPVHPELFNILEDLKPFTDESDRIYLSNNKISTTSLSEQGASFEIDANIETCCFNRNQLSLLENVAEKIDFSLAPQPCLFTGDSLRGALVGIRI